ncbi:MAG: hypothetical protein KKC50_03410, partial [Candidatus Omnitrophica bacterium]|nr:hypothetical protein [Candidatus Omnitrophota bacterium]
MSFSKLSSAFQESGGIRGMEPQPMEPVKLLSAALAGAGLGGLLQLVKNKKKVELDKLAKLVDSIEQGGVTYTDRLTTSLEELMLPPTLPGEMLIKETEEEGKVSILEALTEGYAFLKDLLNAQTLEGVQSILKDQSFLADILLEESRDGFMAILGALIENDEVELNQENIVGQLFPDMNKEIEERKALIKRLLDESTREEVQEQLYDQFLKMAKNGSMANNGYITLLFERPFGIDELLEMNELEIRNLFAENRTEKTIEDLLTLKEAALFCPIEKIREYKSKDDQKSKDNVRSHGLPFSISENDGAYVNGVSQNIYPPSLPAEWKSGLKKEVLPQPLYSPPLEGNSHIDVQNRRKRTPTTSVLIPEDIDLNSSVVNNPRATIIQFSILDAMNSLLASVKNFFILKTIIPLRNSSVKVIQIPQIGKHMHSFRFPAYIWQEFQPLLRALGENIYDTVKTHGLAWTDGDGTLHRIDDLLGGEDSDKTNAVWQAAMEAVNAANKYNASEEITDSSKVKNVIAYHEKLHALFRDRKYKELIARFRQKLEGEEIFGGPLTETHPFITAFRKIYGSPHAAESLHATDTIDWYLEEFLTLSMQEWKLFDKKYAVLDKMMDVADETESSVLNGHEQSVKNGLNNVFEELKKVDQEIISSINRLLEEGKELRETFIEVMSRYNKVRIWKIKIAPSMFIGAGVMMMLPVIMLFSLPGLVAALPIAPWAAGAIAAALVETGIVKIIWVKLRLEKINKLAGFAHALIKGGEYHQALYANEALARRVDEVVRKAGRLESLDDAAVIRSYSGHLESVIKRLSRVVLARELKNYDKKHTADEYETLARGEKVVDGVVTGILKEYNRRTIPDIGEVTVVFKNSEVNSDDWKYLIRAGGIIIVGSNNITEKIAKEHNIPCVKITEEAEREIRSKNRDIPEILLRAGDNGACVLAEKAGYTDKNDMISKQIASKGISISEHFGYYDTELEHLSDVLEILPEGHLRGLKKIRKYWWGDLAGKIFPFQRKSIFVSNNRELGKTSIILHENVHRWLPGLGIAKRIRLLYAVSFKKGSKLRKLIFSKLIVYFSVLAPIVAFLNVYFPLVADIMIVILIMAETRKIVMSKARLPREYQQDFVTAYSWRGMWVDEEFAELYAAYALQGDVFRRLAGYNEKLREKYDILKNNVFYGKEYTRDGLGNISLLKTDKESTGTIPVTG